MARPGIGKAVGDTLAVYDLDVDLHGFDFGSYAFARAIDVTVPVAAFAVAADAPFFASQGPTTVSTDFSAALRDLASAPTHDSVAAPAISTIASAFVLPTAAAPDPGVTLKAGLLPSTIDHGSFVTATAYTDPMALTIKPAEVLTG